MRLRYAKLHRVVGQFYIAGVFIAAPLGVYIQYLNEPLGGARSFTIATMFQSGLWVLTTAIALLLILNGKVQLHRQWMTRSFGTGPLIFLEVRVIGGITGWENLGYHTNEIIVWSCIASSLFFADIVLLAQDLLSRRKVSKAPQAVAPLRAVAINLVPGEAE